jgi:hypothetical protein
MRKLLLPLVVILLAVGATAAEGAGRKPVVKPPSPPTTKAPVGSVVKTPGGVKIGIVIPVDNPPKGENPADPAWVPPCEGFNMGPILYYIGGGDDGSAPTYGVSQYTCKDGDPVTVLNCIANCPPGTPPFIAPPSAQQVIDEIEQIARFPDPIFAPPLENGAFAVVGKRIFFATEPDRYQQIVETRRYPGGWFATATLTPVNLKLTIPEHPTEVCDGPGEDGKTPAGRSASDCYIVVQDAPPGYRGAVVLGIDWAITVQSNIAGVQNRTWTLPRNTTTQADIKQLQAVIVG